MNQTSKNNPFDEESSHAASADGSYKERKEGFFGKVKRKTVNAGHATKLQAYRTKKQAQNQILKKQVQDRKKEFGIEYMDLMTSKAPAKRLKDCFEEAMAEINDLQAQIDRNLEKMEEKEDKTMNEKIQRAPDTAASTEEQPLPQRKTEPRKPLFGRNNKEDKDDRVEPSRAAATGSIDNNNNPQSRPGRPAPPSGQSSTDRAPTGGRGPPGGRRVGGKPPAINKTAAVGNASSPKTPTGRTSTGKSPTGKIPTGKSPTGKASTGRDNGKPRSKTGPVVMATEGPEEYRNLDPKQWKLSEVKFGGSTSFESTGEQEKVSGQSIQEAINMFNANPHKYTALFFQSSMLDWPPEQHQYTLVHREGTAGFKAVGIDPKGWMTMYKYDYERLPTHKNNELPQKARDKYTDNMTFGGKKLHSKKNPPIMPGRGMGVGDTPLLKVIGDVDPSDIHQGSVGDCWLLSTISALAEFDGAIKNLYRKTPNLDQMPHADRPNMYTITLWDLKTWKEVDIVVDERLCAAPDGRLLASKPSEDGELWVCYIEKAFAIHAGGWDKLVGGQCTQAWALMTGCKHQYLIMKNPSTGKYQCYGRYNSNEGRWARHANSPHDGELGMWPMPWPEVGGGGSGELTQDELFLRLVAWDKANYIVGAGTGGESDKNSTDGLVDNHAYSVIESHDNVAGTGIGLLKVRNPWGTGEIENGEFDDDGPGWDKYPQIKKELKPVVADDGIFYVTKKEFFTMYSTIYLSASSMTEFLED